MLNVSMIKITNSNCMILHIKCNIIMRTLSKGCNLNLFYSFLISVTVLLICIRDANELAVILLLVDEYHFKNENISKNMQNKISPAIVAP